MKSYNRGVIVGIGISIFFYITILDITLDTLADFELIAPRKEHTYSEIAYAQAPSNIYAKGISPNLDLHEVTYANANTAHLPLAAIYRVEPVLNLSASNIKEICISEARYNSLGNPEWGAVIRLNDPNLLTNIAIENMGTEPSSSDVFSLVRFGNNDLIQMGRFKLNDPKNYTMNTAAANKDDIHIFFGNKDIGRISDTLTLLSPTHKVLPCHDQIDTDLYQMNHPQWQPLPVNFSGWRRNWE